jgi:hypothetical protein
VNNELGKVINTTGRRLKRLNDELIEVVYSALDDGLTPEAAVRFGMSETKYPQRQRDIVSQGCADAASLPWIGQPQMVNIPLAKNYFLYRDWGGGMTLSKTLHTGEMRREITKALDTYFTVRRDVYEYRKALPSLKSFGEVPRVLRDAADAMSTQGFLSEGQYRSAVRYINNLDTTGITGLRRGYSQALDQILRGDDIQRAVETAVRAKTGYVQQRIMRTEFSRAYEVSFAREIADDSDVVGYRSVLSPSHPVPDICDVYAEADAYGMGEGVFPKSAGAVLPHHPNCICLKEPVFRSEVERVGRYSEKGVEEYARSLTPRKQAQVFGVGHSQRGEWMQSVRKQGYRPDEIQQKVMPKRLLTRREE